jgi:hypothetical protein
MVGLSSSPLPGVRRMNDEPEESEQWRRDMIQIVWILIPVAAFFVLLVLFEWFWLYER